MVMGLSLTRAPGSDTKTVVVGSVSLNGKGEAGTIQIAQDVRIQAAAGVISHENMLRLTKVSEFAPINQAGHTVGSFALTFILSIGVSYSVSLA